VASIPVLGPRYSISVVLLFPRTRKRRSPLHAHCLFLLHLLVLSSPGGCIVRAQEPPGVVEPFLVLIRMCLQHFFD
jgi:hypothetical protein